jgi:hypothetical protein
LILSKLFVFVFTFAADDGTEPKNQKTYGRFLGMIFFGGSKPLVVIERQHLAMPQSSKNRKTAKKSLKYFRLHPCFSANENLIQCGFIISYRNDERRRKSGGAP